MKLNSNLLRISAALLLSAASVHSSRASSHMDAPLITLDPAANTTDVYAFVQVKNGVKSLVTALGVYPFEEPGIGPNKYNFDDNVLYRINVATGADRTAGRATFTYEFKFTTTFKNTNTILQSYLAVINATGDAGQNLVQTYTVTKIDNHTGVRTALGTGTVPPNNQGIATPLYNQGNNGNNPAKPGVATAAALDAYTAGAVTPLSSGYVAFAGQRDDGFYGDINSIFDLVNVRTPGKDSQGGFNIHLMALAIPVSELGGDQQIAGVYATTSRLTYQVVTTRNTIVTNSIVKRPGQKPKRTSKTVVSTADQSVPSYVQVGRQGNPLFNEVLVSIVDKDLYSRSSPEVDNTVFRKYAEAPELAVLLNANAKTGRTDLSGIFIPDVIKVDLSTGACRLAGGGAGNPTNPDDAGFSRLGIFGGDTLTSTVQTGFGGGTVPGGWPNGRRFGDDVVDIAISAVLSDLRTSPPTIVVADGIDGVSANDVAYNKVFPYESTPQNGRNHVHP
ncbi:MAG: DUF4331 domain-containing protein [Terrimicrobiaceae bacterium]|nr:DUF4331 domain-containing protein [Terrimicrobiaceae bacterium]